MDRGHAPLLDLPQRRDCRGHRGEAQAFAGVEAPCAGLPGLGVVAEARRIGPGIARTINAVLPVGHNSNPFGVPIEVRYRFDDIGYQGFQYVVPPLNTQASYLTGQSALQNYTANIFYFVATYKFQ